MTESETSKSENARLAEDIVDDIKPILAGHPPDVQGAVIADLLAIFLIGYPPQMREEVLEFHIDAVRELIDVEDALAFGPAGHPDKEPKTARIPDDHLKAVCKMGEGAACCRFVVAGAEGIECAKHQEEIAAEINRRVAAGAFTAQGDNCPGFGGEASG